MRLLSMFVAPDRRYTAKDERRERRKKVRAVVSVLLFEEALSVHPTLLPG